MSHTPPLTAPLLDSPLRLQQKPKGPVNVTLHVDSTAFRVSLSKYTVSFNSSNWNKPQLVHIRAGTPGERLGPAQPTDLHDRNQSRQ